MFENWSYHKIGLIKKSAPKLILFSEKNFRNIQMILHFLLPYTKYSVFIWIQLIFCPKPCFLGPSQLFTKLTTRLIFNDFDDFVMSYWILCLPKMLNGILSFLDGNLSQKKGSCDPKWDQFYCEVGVEFLKCYRD